MSNTSSQRVYILSALVTALTTVAAGGGLLIGGLYQGNALLRAGWFGNDLVTLLVAVPVLVASLVFSMRGSLRGHLVLLGMLDYTLYNFAYYLFGAAFNGFFLIYVTLFNLSAVALLFGLVGLDIETVGRSFRGHTPAKWIAGYMAFVALGLTVVYGADSLSFVATGQVPEIVINTGHLTNVVFALDLTLVVPWFVLAAIWLWQRRPWGYVLAVILNVKGAVYMLALSAVTVSAVQAGASDDLAQVWLWAFIGVVSLIASVVLLANVEPATA